MRCGTLLNNCFSAFNISFIPREKNALADSLAISASLFRIPLPPKRKYDVEIKYRPVCTRQCQTLEGIRRRSGNQEFFAGCRQIFCVAH
jgi:hypothetical protein